jgi:hypothetical protein
MCSDGDGSDIRRQILMAWGEQKSLIQIADELKLELGLVRESLKQEQKKIVERGGSSYGEEIKG